MMDSQSQEWKFGGHCARLEAPDVLVFRFEGPLLLEEAREVIRIFKQVAASGPVYFVAHLSDTSSSKEVRNYLAQNLRAEWFQAIVLCGAGMLQMAAIKAILISLYLAGSWELLPEFVESEAQAHIRIARLRLQQESRRAAVARARLGPAAQAWGAVGASRQ
jgi:hypothetical protein